MKRIAATLALLICLSMFPAHAVEYHGTIIGPAEPEDSVTVLEVEGWPQDARVNGVPALAALRAGNIAVIRFVATGNPEKMDALLNAIGPWSSCNKSSECQRSLDDACKDRDGVSRMTFDADKEECSGYCRRGNVKVTVVCVTVKA